MLCHPWASTCYDQPYAKFEVSVTTRNEDMKGDTNVKDGVVWGSYGSLNVIENSTIR